MPTPRIHADDAERQRAYRARQKAAQTEPQPKAPRPPRVPQKPGKARRKYLRTQAAEMLQELVEQLQEVYDDHGERWQDSDTGQEWQARIDAAQEALDAVEAMEDEE